MRNVRRRLVAWILQPVVWILLLIPHPVLRVLFRVTVNPLARLLLYRRAAKNLELALGDEFDDAQRREILRKMFRRVADLIADTLGFLRQGKPFADRWIDDSIGRDQMHAFERSIESGWIGVTGHIGNWELLAQWMNLHSLQGVGGIVVKRQPNPHLNAIIERARGRLGMATLYRDQSPVQLVRILRAGHAIGMAPDQDVPSVGGMFIEFFGRPAYTPIGPARLALTARVPMIVAYSIRGADQRERIRFNEPILPDFARPRGEELERLTREWSGQLEAAIRANPEQWLWFHDRWKTTPAKLAAKGRAPLDA